MMNIISKENGVNFVNKISGGLGRAWIPKTDKSNGVELDQGADRSDKKWRWTWRKGAVVAAACLIAGAGAGTLALAQTAGSKAKDTATEQAIRDAARPNIHGFRVSHHRNLTRLVLTMNGPIRFRAYTVDKPYRLVVDLEPVNWRLSSSLALGSGSILKSLTYAVPDTGAEAPLSRVTVALRRPARVQKSFALRPRGKARDWRLVVDLEPVSRDEFDRLKRSGVDRPWRQPFRTAESKKGRLSLAAGRSDVKRRPVIVIDPGHGGIDKGAISPWGLYEKQVVMSVSRLLKKYLRRSGRFDVSLTRYADKFIPLRDRYEIARRRRASLFISIHADAHPHRRMRGLSVHTLSAKASDKLAARLAERENRSDAFAGIRFRGASKSVSSILMDLVRRETRVGAARLSSLIIRNARRRVHLLHKPQRSAGFVVLKAPDVPSVLVELGFLTNPVDEKLLRTERYRKKLAALLARAITGYFDRSHRKAEATARSKRAAGKGRQAARARRQD